jgi:hypothetical protein
MVSRIFGLQASELPVAQADTSFVTWPMIAH